MVTTDISKKAPFEAVTDRLRQQGFVIERQDQNRPWSGFFVLREEQAQAFADAYFDGLAVDDLRLAGCLSPKVLLIAPHRRLSWQYHHRRAEIWQVMQGPVGVATSLTDEPGEVRSYQQGARVVLQQGERHRLVGFDNWGVLAEIWEHTDAEHPSDEDDIVRVQDDFGR